MLDIKLIRKNPEAIRQNLERRQDQEKLELLDRVIENDARWRKLTTQVNDLRKRRNQISSEIGKVIREGDDPSSLRAEASIIPKKLKEVEGERNAVWK
jgi:seryl-tRNA synthetase